MNSLSQLDVATLRLFAAVVDTGSISAAAARCHLSIAAASKRISNLEARLGVVLLRRRARGAQPTLAGEVFGKYAHQMLGMTLLVEEELHDFTDGLEERLRIVANASSIIQSLPFDLAAFVRVHSRVKVDLEEHTSSAIVELLQTDRADVCPFDARFAAAGLTLHPYREDKLVLVLPRDHPLARHRSARFAQTLDYEYVGLRQGTAIQFRMEQGAASLGRLLRVRVQVSSFDTLCRMVEGGVGIGIVPESAAQLFADLRRLRQLHLDEPWAQRRLVLASPPQRIPSVHVLRLIEHLTARPHGGRSAKRSA